MKRPAIRRILGLLSGAALISAGAFEIAVSRSDFNSPKIQPFCEAGFCADQFSPERIFAIAQKASLGDARGELQDFERAVRLSPGSAYRWADLGEAEFNLRNYTQAEYAFSRALAAGPRSPVILMRAANVEFQIGNGEQVVNDLVGILKDPGLEDYYDAAFFTFSRLGLPLDGFLQSAIPQTTAVMSRLLTFWTKVGRVDEAETTWRWAHAHSLADTESTGRFFAFLMKANQQTIAQALWQESVQKLEPGYRKSNWLYNPSFESVPVPSPFDWTIDQQADVEAVRVQDVAQGGKWSLRLRFSGDTNTDYQHASQQTVLEPGRYKLSFLMKTDQVTSDEGVRVHIFDPAQAHLNVWTNTLVGTNDWTNIATDFEVPAAAKEVTFVIDRQPSMSFDNKIGGTVWVDNLRLSRQ